MAQQAPMRILIVDDEPLASQRLNRLLNRFEDVDICGHAEDGASALKLCSTSPPDVVFLDVSMPGMDGLETAGQLLEAHQALQIVFVTASQDYAITAFDLHAADYVVKPVEPERLEKTMVRLRERMLQSTREQSLVRESERLKTALAYLKIEAETDALTGVFNRKRMPALLNEAIGRSARSGQPLACLMLDLDHFKSVNDHHGHPTGDAVLSQLARRIQDNMRPHDIIVRYGGEEFLAVLEQADELGGKTVAERIRNVVAATPFEGPGVLLSVTVSIGGAWWQAGHSAEQLIAQSDQALYHAKADGRNRCYWANIEAAD